MAKVALLILADVLRQQGYDAILGSGLAILDWAMVRKPFASLYRHDRVFLSWSFFFFPAQNC